MKGKQHLWLKLSMYNLPLISNNIMGKINFLKQIFWETQQLHWNFSRPSNYWVIDQEVKNTIWINKSRTAWLTKNWMPFWTFLMVLVYMYHVYILKTVFIIIIPGIPQNMLNFDLSCNYCELFMHKWWFLSSSWNIYM